MGAVRDNNFFVVHGWMINQLGLKGNELQLYAIIYGFSQAEGQCYHGSLQYLADWSNIAKRNVIVRLQSLVDKGLLEKRDIIKNGVKTCEYRCRHVTGDETSSGVVTKHHRGGDETSPGVVTKHHRGGDETSTNNIPDKDIQKDTEKDRDICMGAEAPPTPPPRRTSRFIPPTVEEVEAYCQERGSHVDAQRFVDYYTANGWKVGKNPMKDWKAAVRTWERGNQTKDNRVPFQRGQAAPTTSNPFLAAMQSEGVM